MNNDGTYYTEVFDMERTKDRAQVLKRSKRLKETGPVRRPEMRRDVILPTFWAFLMGWGFILACCLVVIGWWESYDQPRVWYFAFGMMLMLGSLFGVSTLRDRLKHFDNRQIVTRVFELQVADSGRARLLRTDPDNPRRTTIDRYQWQAGKLQEFARAQVDERGAWVGGDTLIRDHLEDYVMSVTRNFNDVVDDFKARRWIRVDGQTKYWTERGKVEMARKAYG